MKRVDICIILIASWNLFCSQQITRSLDGRCTSLSAFTSIEKREPSVFLFSANVLILHSGLVRFYKFSQITASYRYFLLSIARFTLFDIDFNERSTSADSFESSHNFSVVQYLEYFYYQLSQQIYFQILDDRTHPLIRMSGASGYLLSGMIVQS